MAPVHGTTDPKACMSLAGALVRCVEPRPPGTAAGCPPPAARPVLVCSAADWDLMFRAALAFLDEWAVERPRAGFGQGPLQGHGLALRECLQALDQLRLAAGPALGPLNDLAPPVQGP